MMKNHKSKKRAPWARALPVGLALLLVVLALAGPVWVFLRDSYAAGVVADSYEAPDGRQLARIECPWGEPCVSVLPGDVHLQRGALVLGKGVRQAMGPFECVVMSRAPVAVRVPEALRAALEVRLALQLVDYLEEHRTTALIAAAAVMLLGCLFLRLLGALALGFLGAALSGFGVAVLDCEALIAPLHVAVLTGVSLSGFVIGVALGLRRRSLISYLAQYLAMVVLQLSFAGEVAASFGVAPSVVVAIALLGTLVSPAAGLWMLASALLILGLAAEGLGGYLVVLAVGLIIHHLVGGRWFSGPPQDARSRSERVPLSIFDLIRG